MGVFNVDVLPFCFSSYSVEEEEKGPISFHVQLPKAWIYFKGVHNTPVFFGNVSESKFNMSDKSPA